jgi:hypothetical protein
MVMKTPRSRDDDLLLNMLFFHQETHLDGSRVVGAYDKIIVRLCAEQSISKTLTTPWRGSTVSSVTNLDVFDGSVCLKMKGKMSNLSRRR